MKNTNMFYAFEKANVISTYKKGIKQTTDKNIKLHLKSEIKRIINLK